MMDRLPPHSLESETALLGTVLLNPDRFQDDLPLDAFYRTGHRVIWETVRDMRDEGEAVDPVTVADRLKRVGKLEKAGGTPYLAVLTDRGYGNAEGYAKIVMEHHARRQAISAAWETIQAAHDGAPLSDLSDKLYAAAGGLLPKNRRLAHIKTILRDVSDDLERLSQTQQEPGFGTGFPDLDRYLRFMPGEVTVLAGRPGMGKTSLALDMTRLCLLDGRKAFWASLEMSREKLVKRLLSGESMVDGTKFRSAQFADADWPKIARAVGVLAETHLWVDDSPGVSSGHIRAEAQRVSVQMGGLDLVCVDYAQLVEEPGNWTGNKRQEVGRVSRNMIRLAKDLQCHVVLLSQLNREVEKRKPPRPVLSDLKEAGDLEQDADNVVMIYRPEYYEKDATPEDKKGVGEIEVCKSREGPTGMVDVVWLGELTSYRPMARRY